MKKKEFRGLSESEIVIIRDLVIPNKGTFVLNSIISNELHSILLEQIFSNSSYKNDRDSMKMSVWQLCLGILDWELLESLRKQPDFWTFGKEKCITEYDKIRFLGIDQLLNANCSNVIEANLVFSSFISEAISTMDVKPFIVINHPFLIGGKRQRKPKKLHQLQDHYSEWIKAQLEIQMADQAI